MLREHYKFKRMPNDYIIAKRYLPTDPNTVVTDMKYTFLITDTIAAKRFLAEIKNMYRILILLPSTYITVNLIDKSDLP